MSCYDYLYTVDHYHKLINIRKKLEDIYTTLPKGICKGKDCPCLKIIQENIDVDGFNPGSTTAAFGHLQCLQYIEKTNTIDLNNIFKIVVEHGYMDCIKYYASKILKFSPNYIKISMYAACKCPDKNVIEYLHNSGYPINSDLIGAAACYGNTAVLEYLFLHFDDIHVHEFQSAARNGHLSCLKLLYERAVKLDKIDELVDFEAMVPLATLWDKYTDCLNYLISINWTHASYISVQHSQGRTVPELYNIYDKHSKRLCSPD